MILSFFVCFPCWGAAAEPSPALPADVSPATPQSTEFLLTPFRSLGVPPALTTAIEARVAQAIGALDPSYHVITQDELLRVRDVHATMASLGCDNVASCIPELLRLSQARWAVSGSVGKIGQDVVMHINILDARHAAVKGYATRAARETEDVLALVPEWVAEALGRPSTHPPASDAAADTAALTPAMYNARTSFAVLDIRPMGIAPDIADNLTQIVAAQIRAALGASVISRDDMNALVGVERLKQQLGCDDDASCLAEIGGALGVDKLVVGHAGMLEHHYVLSLRMIDVRHVAVEQRITDVFVGQQDELLRAMRHATRRMLNIQIDAEPVGQLSISSPHHKAAVFVDGDMRGNLPMPPLVAMRPDKHRVRVHHEGYLDWHSDVYVAPGETTALWVVLNEKPQHWYQKWWVWTLIGGALIGGGVGTYFGVRAHQQSSGQGTVSIPTTP